MAAGRYQRDQQDQASSQASPAPAGSAAPARLDWAVQTLGDLLRSHALPRRTAYRRSPTEHRVDDRVAMQPLRNIGQAEPQQARRRAQFLVVDRGVAASSPQQCLGPGRLARPARVASRDWTGAGWAMVQIRLAAAATQPRHARRGTSPVPTCIRLQLPAALVFMQAALGDLGRSAKTRWARSRTQRPLSRPGPVARQRPDDRVARHWADRSQGSRTPGEPVRVRASSWPWSIPESRRGPFET
jgi:hypothetical protein